MTYRELLKYDIQLSLCKCFPSLLQYVNQKKLFDYVCIFPNEQARFKISRLLLRIYYEDVLNSWVTYINDKQAFIDLIKYLDIMVYLNKCKCDLMNFILDNFDVFITEDIEQQIFIRDITKRTDLSIEIWNKILSIYLTRYIYRKNLYPIDCICENINNNLPKELRNKLEMTTILMGEDL